MPEGANRVYVTVGGGTGFDLQEVFLDAKDINKDELTEKRIPGSIADQGTRIFERK